MAITRKKVIRYAVFPGIKPRFSALVLSGFQYISFFIALVYQTVRLLPANHPYTNPQNIGKFGIRHVIAQAADNLVINRHNIDQILLFTLVLIAIAMVIIQLLMVAVGLFVHPVMAQAPAFPTNFAGFFVTEFPKQDIAFMFLDMIFGVPGSNGQPSFFNSCIADSAVNCVNLRDEDVLRMGDDWQSPGEWMLTGLGWPHPIHIALRQLFQWYSFGLLVVAVIIAGYFAITIVLETAQTGTPFGKRFNKVWAPIRIVVAFGLLVPVGHGLNSAQYIVLYAAKFGSSFATNGWIRFNETLTGYSVNFLSGPNGGAPTVRNRSLVSTPNLPDVGALMQFIFVARVCKHYEWIKNQRVINAYLVKDPLAPDNRFLVEESDAPDATPTYQQFVEFADGAQQVVVRFSDYVPGENSSELGHVSTKCGEVILPLSDPRIPGSDNPPEPGAAAMQEAYWNVLRGLWFYLEIDNYPANVVARYSATNPNSTAPLPDATFVQDMGQFMDDYLGLILYGNNHPNPAFARQGAIELQMASASWDMVQLYLRGWAGAGLWYNKVAELYGFMTLATMNVPIIRRFPQVQEQLLAEKLQQNRQVSPGLRYKPVIAGSGYPKTLRPEDLDAARVYWEAFRLFNSAGFSSSTHTAVTGNAFNDMINTLLGTSGLYSLARNEGTHPLAMLTGVGRALIESSVKNLGFSMAAATTGAAFSFLVVVQAGQISEVAVGLFMTFAMIGMTVGFVLFYVIPFLPFIYCFFAVAGWCKGILEATVGVSLWALAHIRIDGEGLPGSAATNGYFLIFEIFLRPILIVFGMLASITTFSALVKALHNIWQLVTANLAGFDVATENQLAAGSVESLADVMRGPIDEFFFTVIYTIIVYLLATSSFKLIDHIPNNIMRWMGQSLQTFNDAREDPASNLTQKTGVGSQQVVDSVGGGMEGLLKKVATANK